MTPTEDDCPWHAWRTPDVSLARVHVVAVFAPHDDTFPDWRAALESLLSQLPSFHGANFPGSVLSWSLHGPLRLGLPPLDGERGANTLFDACAATAQALLAAGTLPPCVASSSSSSSSASSSSSELSASRSSSASSASSAPSESSVAAPAAAPTHVCFAFFADSGSEAVGPAGEELRKYYCWAQTLAQHAGDAAAAARALAGVRRAGGSRALFLGAAAGGGGGDGGSRAWGGALARAGLGVGVVTSEAFRTPSLPGSAAVLYHEAVGHGLGLPHPPRGASDRCVMGRGMYTGAPLAALLVEPALTAGCRRRGAAGGRSGEGADDAVGAAEEEGEVVVAVRVPPSPPSSAGTAGATRPSCAALAAGVLSRLLPFSVAGGEDEDEGDGGAGLLAWVFDDAGGNDDEEEENASVLTTDGGEGLRGTLRVTALVCTTPLRAPPAGWAAACRGCGRAVTAGDDDAELLACAARARDAAPPAVAPGARRAESFASPTPSSDAAASHAGGRAEADAASSASSLSPVAASTSAPPPPPQPSLETLAGWAAWRDATSPGGGRDGAAADAAAAAAGAAALARHSAAAAAAAAAAGASDGGAGEGAEHAAPAGREWVETELGARLVRGSPPEGARLRLSARPLFRFRELPPAPGAGAPALVNALLTGSECVDCARSRAASVRLLDAPRDIALELEAAGAPATAGALGPPGAPPAGAAAAATAPARARTRGGISCAGAAGLAAAAPFHEGRWVVVRRVGGRSRDAGAALP